MKPRYSIWTWSGSSVPTRIPWAPNPLPPAATSLKAAKEAADRIMNQARGPVWCEVRDAEGVQVLYHAEALGDEAA